MLLYCNTSTACSAALHWNKVSVVREKTNQYLLAQHFLTDVPRNWWTFFFFLWIDFENSQHFHPWLTFNAFYMRQWLKCRSPDETCTCLLCVRQHSYMPCTYHVKTNWLMPLCKTCKMTTKTEVKSWLTTTTKRDDYFHKHLNISIYLFIYHSLVTNKILLLSYL